MAKQYSNHEINLLLDNKLPAHTLGDWYVSSDNTHWYIINIQTYQIKQVGKIQRFGVNYYDRAQTLASLRNHIAIEQAKGTLPSNQKGP